MLLQTIQLFEMIIVRHGLMVVGLPFSGKSCSLNMLAGALTDLKAGKCSEHQHEHACSPDQAARR